MVVDVETHFAVKHGMQGIGAIRKLNKVAFINLGESIVKRIHIAIPKFGMIGRFPLVDYIHNLGLWQRFSLSHTDDQVICLSIGNLIILISLDASILTMPKAEQLTKCTIDREVKILQNVASVTTCELNCIGENQIVTNKWSITCT